MDHHDSMQFGLCGHDGAEHYGETDDGGEGSARRPAVDREVDGAFEENSLRYYAAKAEVARLAKLLGITPRGEDRGAGHAGGAVVAKSAAEERAGYPSAFGRGWIPAEREIGVAGDEYLPGTGRETSVAGGGVATHSPGAEGWGQGPLHHDAAHRGPPPRPGEVLTSRTPRHSDFTPHRRATFLHCLADGANVAAACRAVGIARQSAYLARRSCAVFRAGWDAALVHGRFRAEEDFADLVFGGLRDDVWYKGEKVGERRRVDARLVLAQMARLDARTLEARADPLAAARAERFDELVALVAGAVPPAGLTPGATRDANGEAIDPLLPRDRARHSLLAAEAAYDETKWGEEAEDGDVDPDEEPALIAAAEARALAHAECDAWDERCIAIGAAIVAGEPLEFCVSPAAHPELAEGLGTPSDMSLSDSAEAASAKSPLLGEVAGAGRRRGCGPAQGSPQSAPPPSAVPAATSPSGGGSEEAADALPGTPSDLSLPANHEVARRLIAAIAGAGSRADCPEPETEPQPEPAPEPEPAPPADSRRRGPRIWVVGDPW